MNTIKLLMLGLREWVLNFAKDMQSLRAIWVWIILSLFCWGFVYLLKNGSDTVIQTVYTIFGGVASWVLTNYVISRAYEKKMENTKKERN